MAESRNGSRDDVNRLSDDEIRRDLAARIDHTLLRADSTPDDMARICAEARSFGFAAVCVNGVNVQTCRKLLVGSGVMVVAVVGFPLGAMRSDVKAFETRQAVLDGADEIDMVLQLGLLKSGDRAAVIDDIRGVVLAASPCRVKVIIEAGCLDHDQKVAACELARLAGAHFVKTSTGFGPGGATVGDVALMQATVGDALKVKASGGIRTTADALKMIGAGASRIGTSASVAIVTGNIGERGY